MPRKDNKQDKPRLVQEASLGDLAWIPASSVTMSYFFLSSFFSFSSPCLVGLFILSISRGSFGLVRLTLDQSEETGALMIFGTA